MRSDVAWGWLSDEFDDGQEGALAGAEPASGTTPRHHSARNLCSWASSAPGRRWAAAPSGPHIHRVTRAMAAWRAAGVPGVSARMCRHGGRRAGR